MLNAEQNIQKIKCYNHNEQIQYVCMSRVSETGSRILCQKCKKGRESVPLKQFISLCMEFQASMYEPQQGLVQSLRDAYTNIIQQIQDLLQVLQNKMQSALFKAVYKDGVQDGLTKLLTDQKNYNLKDFETLAQLISENVEPQGYSYVIVENKVDDQKLAESNELCDFSRRLLNTMNKLYFESNLINQNINIQEKVKSDPHSIKLITNTKNFIADVQFNFDQTIIGARYAETMNSLLFWKYTDKWQFWGQLQCHKEKLINFKFSKHSNQIITCGADDTVTKQTSLKLWKLDNFWIEQAILYQSFVRLSCLNYNNSENMVVLGQGSTIVVLEKYEQQFTFSKILQKQSEIITTLAFNSLDTFLAAGAADQSVTLWAYKEDTDKFILQQKLQIFNTPKLVIFSSLLNELFVCTKDGLLHIFNYQQGNFKETQKIINNIDKIRTIGLSKDSSVLGVGGETNSIQLWRKNGIKWLCFEEIKQDDFIEAISFGDNQRIIASTNNTQINIHYNYY